MCLEILIAVTMLSQAAGSTYTSNSGQYTINMPAKPVEKTRNLDVAGSPVKLTIASAKRGVIAYTSGFAEITGDPQAALAAAKADLVSQSKGDLKDDAEANLSDVLGRSITIDVPKKVVAGGAVVQGRTLVVGNRLYVLSATIPSARVATSKDEVNAYFASFRPERPAVVAKPSSEGLRSGSPKMEAAGANGKATLGLPWKDFTPAGHSIVVKMPGEVTEKSSTQPTPSGPLTSTIYVGIQGKTVFLLIPSPVPGLRPNQANSTAFFASYKAGATEGTGAKLLKERSLNMDGNPAIEITCDLPVQPGSDLPNGGTQITRCVLITGMSYTLSAVTPKGQTPSPDIQAYFDSFRTKNGDDPAKVPSGALDKAWPEFAPPGEGFSVKAPGKPALHKIPGMTEGPAAPHVFDIAVLGRLYRMAARPVPEAFTDQTESEQAVMEKISEGMLKSFNLRNPKTKSILVDGHAAMEFAGEATENGPTKGEIQIGRLVLDKGSKRFFFFMIKGGSLTSDSPEVRAFLDSIHITHPAR